MKKLLSFLIIFSLIFSTTFTAHAAKVYRPKKNKAKTHSGIVLSNKEANKLMDKINKLQKENELLKEYQRQNKIRKGITKIDRKQAKVLKDINGAYEEHIDDLTKRLHKAEKRRNAWYKSPLLWFIMGAGVTIGIGVGAKKL